MKWPAGFRVGGSNRAVSVMWTYKQCKTMLTHVFKPRWLVLILLSAGNRECRCERRTKESERERERGRERDVEVRARETEQEEHGARESNEGKRATLKGDREKENKRKFA